MSLAINLMEYEPTVNIRACGPRLNQLQRMNITVAEAAEMCGTTPEVMQWLLQCGDLHVSAVADGGPPAFAPLETFPTKVARAIVMYRRLQTWAELAPVPVAKPVMNETVARLEFGTVDAAHVAQLTTDLRGFSQRGAVNATPVQRVQALGLVSVASVAAVIGAEPAEVFAWLTGTKGVPLSTVGEAFWHAVSYLMLGPVLNHADSKAARAGSWSY